MTVKQKKRRRVPATKRRLFHVAFQQKRLKTYEEIQNALDTEPYDEDTETLFRAAFDHGSQ